MAQWIKEPDDLSHIPRTQVKGQRAGEQYTPAIPALLWGRSEDRRWEVEIGRIILKASGQLTWRAPCLR